jgi:DNA-binding MarR family transcriptional regulator
MLAARLYLSPSSVTILLRRLVAKRLITIESRPLDRRSKLVVAFDRTLEADQIDPLPARLREISASLTSADARVITAYLERITEAVRLQTLRLARSPTLEGTEPAA